MRIAITMVLMGAAVAVGQAPEPSLSDDALLDRVSRAAFGYFLHECDPTTFLTRDSNQGPLVSVAACGFGLSALCVGAERGWMARDEAARRAGAMLDALVAQTNNRVRGVHFHYLEGDGSRSTHGYEDVVSTVDSALLGWGAVAAGEYFGGSVKAAADRMIREMDWRFFVREHHRVAMAYRPQEGRFDGAWDYYTDEALLIALLGLSAPDESRRLDLRTYRSFRRERKSHAAVKNVIVSWPGALFTYTFAHVWLDFRTLGRDRDGVDWFENSVKAVRAHRAYAIELSRTYRTFGENAWGLTASSGPDRTYVVGGAPPCGGSPNPAGGTLAPYGAAMSVPFLPKESLAAIRHYYEMRGPDGKRMLWRDPEEGGYGLVDAYNLDRGWVSDETQGIDHGPMLLLIENYRSGLLWRTVLQNDYVRAGLRRAGFRAPP